MRLIYFGHSAFQITTGGTTILVDPFITGNVHATGIVTPEDLSQVMRAFNLNGWVSLAYFLFTAAS